MVGAAQVKAEGRQVSAAIVHVDGSARPQVISSTEFVGTVLHRLEADGSAPILINTSFNGRGAPIVDGIADAYASALMLGLDFLVAADRLLLLSEASRR